MSVALLLVDEKVPDGVIWADLEPTKDVLVIRHPGMAGSSKASLNVVKGEIGSYPDNTVVVNKRTALLI